MILNTSFNLKGQPIVESPRDALMTFYGCGLDALVIGGERTDLVAAFADDVADALHEARTRIATLRSQLGGADPLNVLDVPIRQRASDAGAAGADRVRTRLVAQADAARALARLADLAGVLTPKLFEADRRR